jgi:hypothetical protein
VTIPFQYSSIAGNYNINLLSFLLNLTLIFVDYLPSCCLVTCDLVGGESIS